MANRRMFSKKITETDLFLDMPMSAQCLYFHLNMSADDDGFIGNAKTIKRMVGASEDDLKLLFAKEFLIPFENGVVVIKDWKIHNYIRKDTYNKTMYTAEKKRLGEDVNGSYTLRGRSVDGSSPQDRLGKDRLGKDSKDSLSGKPDGGSDIPYDEIISYLNEKANKRFKVVSKHKDLIKARWNEGQRFEDFQTVIDNMAANWQGVTFSNGKKAETYLQPSTLFGNKFEEYRNQVPEKKQTHEKQLSWE